MGCHTWTYKKVTALSEEEKQYFVGKEISELKDWWGFSIPIDEVVEEVTEWFNNDPQKLFAKEKRTSKKYALDMVQKYKDKLKDYQENGFEAFIRDYSSKPTAILKSYNGELYINIGFDDPCRVYGYPEEKFTDVDEFINWLKVTDNTIGYYQSDYDGFENNVEFIEGFTEGLEKEIKDYFKLHGEDNLLIEFG